MPKIIIRFNSFERLEKYLDSKLNRFGIEYYFDTITEKINLLRGKYENTKKIMVKGYEFNIEKISNS
jgi:hypothetical protein